MHDPDRPTIHDVARVARVSHQTVSNVLRGRGRVGEAARARVEAAVAALHYRPHAGAASLRTRRSRGVAHPIAVGELSPSNTIMLEFIESLASAASRRDHHLVLSADADAGTSHIEQLIHAGTVDAVVLASVQPGDARVATLARLRFPFACFGRTDPSMPQTWIDVDNRAGVEASTTHLIGAGHERVAFLGYSAQGRWDVEREDGYRGAMAVAGLDPLVETPAPDPAHVQEAIDRLLDGVAPATGIVTGSDVLASAVYAAAVRRGMAIGSDLAVTGFDGSTVGRLLAPALTTVVIPIAVVTERLIARALAEVEGPTGDPGEVVVPELVVGESS